MAAIAIPILFIVCLLGLIAREARTIDYARGSERSQHAELFSLGFSFSFKSIRSGQILYASDALDGRRQIRTEAGISP
jgi:hypothetical protein